MDQSPSPMPPQSSRAESTALVLTACIIGALMIYLVLIGNFIFGSWRGNWVYLYLPSHPYIPAWTIPVVLLSLGLFVFLGNKLIQTYERITLLVLFLVSVFVQSLISTIYPHSFAYLVKSDRVNGFFTAAMSHSTLDLLSNYSSLLSSLPHHARSNLPGKILLFDLFKVFTTSPEMMGYLVIVVSSLGGLLLYGICKRLFHDRKIAFYALALYVVIPSKLFFFPVLNTVTPVFMLLSLYLFVLFLDTKRPLIPWLLGISLYILFLYEPSPLITGILMLGIALHALKENKLFMKELWRLLLYAFLAFLAMDLLFYVVFHFEIVRAFLYVLNDATKFNVRQERGYLIWLVENPREFFYGTGVPVMIIFIYMTMLILTQIKRLKDLASWSLENVYVISLLVTFLVVLFLGINRGEVTRLWIYLAVLFQIPAASFIAKTGKGTILFFVVVAVIAIQAIATLYRVSFTG